jgi:hypothetical protein
MKLELKLEFDTDNEQDLEKIETVLYHLQQIKEMLEVQEQNLNKTVGNKRSKK